MSNVPPSHRPRFDRDSPRCGSTSDADRGLPPEVQNRLAPALLRVVDSTQRRRRILALVQDALGQLRLDMKYLMFDLEATRRERDELRAELDGD